MQLIGSELLLSASDLSKHLACRHATALDLMASRGEIERIHRNDPSIEVLVERGRRHEAAYIAYLQDKGLDVLVEGEGLKRTHDAFASTARERASGIPPAAGRDAERAYEAALRFAAQPSTANAKGAEGALADLAAVEVPELARPDVARMVAAGRKVLT